MFYDKSDKLTLHARLYPYLIFICVDIVVFAVYKILIVMRKTYGNLYRRLLGIALNLGAGMFFCILS